MKHFYLTLVLEFKEILYFISSVFLDQEITSERSWRPDSISGNPGVKLRIVFFDKDEGRKQPRPNIIVLFGYRAVQRQTNIYVNLKPVRLKALELENSCMVIVN